MDWYALAILACPLSMGVMMWLMMRSNKHSPASAAPPASEAEVTQLRAELEDIRATQRTNA